MADSLDALLEPGERVVYRARQGWRAYLTLVAGLGLFAFGFSFAIDGIAGWLSLPGYGSPLSIIIPLELLVIYVLFYGRAEAVVTDRRLLLNHWCWFRWRSRETPHDRITAVRLRGLWRAKAIVVSTGPADQLAIDGLPALHPLARALAEAAGLPAPREPGHPSIAERAAGVLDLAATAGSVIGALVLILAPLPWVQFKDPDWVNIVAIIVLFTFVVPIFAGLALGWLAGTLLALAYLRPMVSAAELREAIQLSFDRSEGRYDDLSRWTRPNRLRLARLFFGRAMRPPEQGAGTHG